MIPSHRTSRPPILAWTQIENVSRESCSTLKRCLATTRARDPPIVFTVDPHTATDVRPERWPAHPWAASQGYYAWEGP